MDTSTDIILSAQVDDMLMIGSTGLWLNEAGDARLEVVTLVGGSPVSYISGGGVGGGGVLSWRALPVSTYIPFGGDVPYKVVAGDISGGLVTLRWMVKVSSASRTLQGDTADTFTVWAINIGPEDPT